MLKHYFGKLKALYQSRDKKKQALIWMLNKTRTYLKQLTLLILIDVLLSGMGLGSTLISKRLIDRAGSGGADVAFFVYMAVLTLGSIGIGALTRIFSTLIHERYAFGVRSQVFDGVMRSKWAAVSKYHSEDLLTRLTSDVDTVSNGIAHIIPTTIYLIVRLAASFAVLFYYEKGLAVGALLLGPVSIIAGLLFAQKLHAYQKKLKENESQYRTFMQESLSNITLIKTFQREDGFEKRLGAIRMDRLKIIKKRNMISAITGALINCMFSLGYLMAFGWSIYRLSRGEITYGTMSLFLSLVSFVQGPIYSLSDLLTQSINVLASAERVIEIDALPREQAHVQTDLQGAIGVRLTNVDFSYDQDLILSKVQMDIAPKQTTALLGDSGAGKTTIAKLLLHLIEPDQGEIVFYDDNGHEERCGEQTRQLIAYVPQGNTLLSGTIRENLLLGMETATDEQLWQALRIADADTFVRDLPKGLDTIILESAKTLSQGQAQRLCIARALIRNAKLLILDEATSSLDIACERRIVENLGQYAVDLTCLVITHRPSLLDICTNKYRVTDRYVRQQD